MAELASAEEVPHIPILKEVRQNHFPGPTHHLISFISTLLLLQDPVWHSFGSKVK